MIPMHSRHPHSLPVRLARGLMVLTICLSLGLQWAALQGIAWTGMLINFARDGGSLTEAMSKTFDGEHPCPLCKAVEKGSKQEQDKTVQSPIKKMDAVLLTVSNLIAPQGRRVDYPTVEQRGARRAMPPPGEPPKGVLG